jgi:hypothetical protein
MDIGCIGWERSAVSVFPELVFIVVQMVISEAGEKVKLDDSCATRATHVEGAARETQCCTPHMGWAVLDIGGVSQAGI